tara:strand:+ start:2633 stop:3799 length:1167 start_codon:yes stop_codon:yes gene_type:complete
MSSSKPIEDEIQVREVGESSRVNKIDINSQSLPLPPMTVNQFEDAVANIAKEIIDFGKPTESIDISNLSTNSESISTTQIDDISSEINKVSRAQVPVVPAPASASPAAAPEPAKAEDPETTLSGIESAITELLSKLDSIKGSSSGGGGGGDLTTRDYVDQVLGGERNLEGENLVDVANFVGKEDGISLRQEEDGSFTKIQDGEVVQEDMTEREANDLVQELEQKDTEKNDEATAAVAQNEDPNSPSVETTIEKDVDVATEEARPFSFSTNYLIIVTYHDGQDFFDIFESIRDEPPAPLNGFYYIECTVTNGKIDSTEFKSGGDTIWVGSVSDMTETTGTGYNEVQTKAYIPVAMETGGELHLLNTGGCYSETIFCVNGSRLVYPMKIS